MELLKKLLAGSHSQIKELPLEQWQEVPPTLLASLSREFSLQLENTGALLPKFGEVQPGVTVSFQSPPVGDPGLCLRVEGVVGLQSDPDHTVVSASLFLFLNGNRVVIPGHDYYELKLKLVGEDVEWERLGWQKDLYGEFEAVRNWGDTSR